MMDIDGKHEWRDCIEVPGVRLPRGYYFGTSSITGDLSGTAVRAPYWPYLGVKETCNLSAFKVRSEMRAPQWLISALWVPAARACPALNNVNSGNNGSRGLSF